MSSAGVEEAGTVKDVAQEAPLAFDIAAPPEEVKTSVVEKASEIAGTAVEAMKDAVGASTEAQNGKEADATASDSVQEAPADSLIEKVLDAAHHAAEVATDAVEKVLDGVSNAPEEKVDGEDVNAKHGGLSHQVSMGKRAHNEAFGSDGAEVEVGGEKRAMGGA
eukprot:TRINITY_DN1627_c0_g1_i1.p1 TRINITY_DN1627_c0_g1~~TRINITY_DN1627_c0_g1_i1.p1  ORF type:complete len:164 (+),score=67.80 TRINITY_DN1627_c0_g1_i1:183-674(+)